MKCESVDPQRSSLAGISTDSRHHHLACSEEAYRRDKFFNKKFGKYVKTTDGGVLCLERNKRSDMKKIVSAHSLDHGDYLDARIYSRRGILKDASFEDVRTNLEKDMIGRRSWKNCKFSRDYILSLFNHIKERGLNNERNFCGILNFVMSKFQDKAKLGICGPLQENFFVGAGFTSRFDKDIDPGKGMPTAIPGNCDFIIPMGKKGIPKYAATIELKLPLRNQSKRKIEADDALAPQTWSSGIGANVHRFMSLTPYEFAIYIRTALTDFVPTTGPTLKYQYAKYPPGDEMASFDDYEHIEQFMEILYDYACLSGIDKVEVQNTELESSAPSLPGSDIDTCDDMRRPNKRKTIAGCLSSKRSKTDNFLCKGSAGIKKRNYEPVQSWLAACEEGPDMVLYSIDFASLPRKMRSYLEAANEAQRACEGEHWIDYKRSINLS